MLTENDRSKSSKDKTHVLMASVISGAVAAVICDFLTFPLDTLKTRLQSQHGFINSGGFRRLYRGLGPILIGSPPAAAFFFITYDGMKEVFQPRIPEQYHSIIHMIAASLGEMFACMVRVPVEVVKQRKQALLKDTHRLPLKMLYRGYGGTVMRDLPVSLIQLPLWEYFKSNWKNRVDRECTPMEGAACGALSVAISAVVTTPLDVAKTRIMLSNTSAKKDEVKIFVMLTKIYQESGVKGLFAGFSPRVGGFTLSGLLFFGMYEKFLDIYKSRI